MDELDPDLLKAITEAGLYGQRQQPLQQRYAMGQQFMQAPQAQGASVGGTYVAASPFEHLANAVRQLVGAKMASGAMQGQQDLTANLGAGRQAYAQALQRMGGQAPPGTPPMLARPADPQGMQRLAMLGALSGDPGMQHASQAALQERHLGIQESQMADMMRHRQILEGQGQQKIGQTERQQKTVFDAWNNPVTTPTHAPTSPPSVLPRSTAPGGGSQPPSNGDPAKTYPFGRSGPNQASIDKYAEQLAVTGQLPPSKWGKASATINSAISNRMTELYPEASLAANKADYVSNVNSQRKLQLAQDSLESFEKGMLKNGRLMLDSAKGIVDTGSPLFNQPIRAWKLKAGDPKVAAFNAARQVFVQEAGKVLGGAVQGGGLTEGQRHEAEGLMRGDFTLPQMEATLQTLEADAANRKSSAEEQLQSVRSRMSGKGHTAPQAQAPSAPAPAVAPTAQPHPQDSAAVQWAKAHPTDPRAAQILQVNGAQ